ncbi:methyl-accepting chemotaxis protein [Paenisporosarcina cavernae]|uniref:Methyl-accepting chemotaxis protein n=1 Tax=Paenisporosarcina cavernae TaxID=2320858 RepID=A0A385YPM0_9BACL|nr:methyl-accepting chemotaxis protein [Paenisporosarcina cavernae]AYC28679.1 methyl-accepting chemotaxis protein [Paenisporosarcina cavernae]
MNNWKSKMPKLPKRKKTALPKGPKSPKVKGNKKLGNYSRKLKSFGDNATAKMSIRKKLLLAFSLIILLFLIVSGIAIYSSLMLNQSTQELNNKIIPRIDAVKSLNYEMENVVALTQRHVLSTDINAKRDTQDRINERVKHVNELLDTYGKLLSDPMAVNLHEDIVRKWEDYIANNEAVLVASTADNQKLAVQKTYTGNVQYDSIQRTLDELVYIDFAEAEKLQKQSSATFASVIVALSIGIILAILATVGIALFIVRLIRKPVSLLSDRFKAMATGDLTVDEITIKNKDEFGDLAGHFNTMLGTLQQLVRDLQSSISTVAMSAEQVSVSAAETSRATEQITESMADVSEGAEVQAESVRHVRESIGEMSIGMEQASAAVSNVSDKAVSTTELTTSGLEVMDETRKKMNEIRTVSEESAKVVQGLGTKSDEIGQIVDVIKAIAEQTNLLALNAAIEAARAGEHGKGFAVVADEVRKLAEQSANAAKDIHSRIASIQKEVKEAIHSMEGSSKEVALGIGLAEKSSQSYDDIAKMISDVSAQTEEITAIIQEMNASAQQMETRVKDVETLSAEASERAQTVAAAAEEQNASMEEITSSSDVLSNLSSDLQKLVQQFKI